MIGRNLSVSSFSGEDYAYELFGHKAYLPDLCLPAVDCFTLRPIQTHQSDLSADKSHQHLARQIDVTENRPRSLTECEVTVSLSY